MNITRKTITSSLWFALEVIGIFVVVQFIRFVIGNLNAFYSGLILVTIALLLFAIALLIAKNKDNQNPRKPKARTFTGLFG
jgi:TctA family transporter